MSLFRRKPAPCRNCRVLKRWANRLRADRETFRGRIAALSTEVTGLANRLAEQRAQYEDELQALRALANTLAAERLPQGSESLHDLQLALAAKAEDDEEAPASPAADSGLSHRLDQVYFSYEPPATTVWAKDLLNDDE